MLIESSVCLNQEEALTELTFFEHERLYNIAVKSAKYLREVAPQLDLNTNFENCDSQDLIDWFTEHYTFSEEYQSWYCNYKPVLH